VTPAPPAPVVSEAALGEAFARAGAEQWGLSRALLAETLGRAVRARFGAAVPSETAVQGFIATLHLPDLALACACGAGHDGAWDHFVLTYRPELYRAARAMTDDAAGRELADSLYADLFGLAENDGVRRSLFRYYHGRAKLSTWLRSVLAQRHVDLVRARRRLTSLDDPGQPLAAHLPARPSADPAQTAAMRVAAEAVTAALGVLTDDERLRLAYYYVHGVTLAQTGRLRRESEATASRKLERARKALRGAIETELGARGLAMTEVDDWRAVAKDAWDTSLAEALGVPPPQENGPAPFKGQKP